MLHGGGSARWRRQWRGTARRRRSRGTYARQGSNSGPRTEYISRIDHGTSKDPSADFDATLNQLVFASISSLFLPSHAVTAGLFWRMGPATTLASQSRPGLKQDKSRISLALTTNATGDDAMEVWAIGKAKVPHALRGFPFALHEIVWRSNAKAWMTGEIMAEWLHAFYRRMESRKPGQQIVLLLDNFSGHQSGLTLAPPPENIVVKFLPKNSTSVFQPMDQGIISAFKKAYKSRLVKWQVGTFPGEVNSLKNMCLRRALIWVSSAWFQVNHSTIGNCWRHSTCVEGGDESAAPVEAEEENGADLGHMMAQCVPEGETVLSEGDFLCPEGEDDAGEEPLTHEAVMQSVIAQWRSEAGGEAGGEAGSEAGGESGEYEGDRGGMVTSLNQCEALECCRRAREYVEERGGGLDAKDLRDLRRIEQKMARNRAETARQTTLPQMWRRAGSEE